MAVDTHGRSRSGHSWLYYHHCFGSAKFWGSGNYRWRHQAWLGGQQAGPDSTPRKTIVLCMPGSHVKQAGRSEEHTSELQSLMRISYAVFCLQKNNIHHTVLSITTDVTALNVEQEPLTRVPRNDTSRRHENQTVRDTVTTPCTH